MVRAWLVTVALAVTVTVTHTPVAVVAGRAGPSLPGSFAYGSFAYRRVAAVEQTKYYIVGGARDGQRETLFSMAASTLGNGNRYPEIVALNRDRIQPDGDRLTDPLVVKPGWVLELPADATGPEVRVGPLPVVPAPTTPPQRASAPSEGSAVDSDAGGAGPGATLGPLTRLLSVVVIVALLGLTLLALLRRQRLDHILRAWLTQRRPVRAAEASSGAAPESMTLVGLGWPTTPLPAPPVARSADPPALDRAAGAAAGRPSILDTEVRDGDDSLAICLAGQQELSDSPVYTWASDGEPISRAPDAVPAVVGIGPQGTLVVDLARAPDVITMTGPDDGPRRQARRLAEQLIAAGVRVSATVGAFDEPGLFGIHILAGPDDPALADALAGAGPHVLFCPGEPARGREWESRSIRRLVSRRSPVVVVILVGSPRRSRWRIEVRPGNGAYVARIDEQLQARQP